MCFYQLCVPYDIEIKFDLSTQQRNKGYYPNLHGWDFSIPPSPQLLTKAKLGNSKGETPLEHLQNRQYLSAVLKFVNP